MRRRGCRRNDRNVRAGGRRTGRKEKEKAEKPTKEKPEKEEAEDTEEEGGGPTLPPQSNGKGEEEGEGPPEEAEPPSGGVGPGVEAGAE